ncbi:MAG TPA: biopolymer transporter ExbD [Cyanobacteria bacterium UBA11991]|nr:biopolymer transporter ExbD [Cyanobacteriota bacterium]MDY6358302.1 biopolymer transporter ExbD [Cyanobacteriota bacterium]MDY6363385.1 biopolymer transporter ExbD [Cyanobacteriota bacterium]MDY6382484.1 biopolymer transporter ExbD [Cyanobacteriota bacterium]HCB11878.1 biopolymer transporter ExbD [Cyanobacteria bacterium UBA11991]
MARKTFHDINITPLTDIFLVLLIIMMVVAPLLDQQGISLSVPENVEEQKIDKNPQILTVYVTKTNQYYINNEEIAADNLGTVLSQEMKNYPDGMLIKTDSDSTHGAVVKLMDNARSAGVKAISIDRM